MAKLNYLSTGYTITDETVSRASSTALRIGHDLIKATGFEIWTGSGKTGTQLTLTTDYVLSAEATDYTTKVGSTIYTKLAIVNGAYLNTTLYISYVTVGDYASVENVKELSWDTCKTAAQWTSDNTILGLGETGRETDTGKEKTGDGVTSWNSLGYSLAPLSSTPSAGNVMVWGTKKPEYVSTNAIGLVRSANRVLYGSDSGSVLCTVTDSGNRTAILVIIVNINNNVADTAVTLMANTLSLAATNNIGTVAVSGATGVLTYTCKPLESSY